MTDDLEHRLGLALQARSAAIVAAEELPVRALERGRAVRRRRRVAGGAVAAATVVVVAVVAIQAAPATTDSQPVITPSLVDPTPGETDVPPSEPPTLPPDPGADLAAWLNALPIGDPLGVPYATPTELVDGSTRVPLPLQASAGESPEVFSVIARTSAGGDGWLVKASGQSGDGSGAARVGRLDPAGGFVELAAAPSSLQAAMSPDGAMVAVTTLPFTGDSVRIISVVDGTEITAFGLAASEHLVGWAPSGLVVRDMGETPSVRLVRLDGSTEELAATVAVVVDSAADLAVLEAGGCWRVVELSAPGVALSEFCDGGGSVSPDGRWRVGVDALGEGGYRIDTVLDLDTGETSRLPLPEAPDGMFPLGWEDTDHVLFDVSVYNEGDGPVSEGVVRCSVRTLQCEIALPVAPHDGGPPYVVMSSE